MDISRRNTMKANILQMKRMRRIVPAGKSADGPRPKTLKPAAIIALAAFSLLLISAVTNAMYIDKNGNVGIGTSAPAAMLDVNGSVNIAKDLKIGGKITGRIHDETGEVMPIGVILPYYGTVAPEGWLLCDGYTDLSADPKYAALRNICGNKVPDLRGVFLRGVDNGRGLDSGRSLGSYQGDALQQHTHEYTYRGGTQDSDLPGHEYDDIWRKDDDRQTGGVNGASVASETRPKNVAVNFIIKY
jgi:hypothetical protein